MKINFSNTGKIEYEKRLKSDSKNKLKSEDLDNIKRSASDKLEISNESRTLSLVSSRLKSGYYNNPDVFDELVERLSQDL